MEAGASTQVASRALDSGPTTATLGTFAIRCSDGVVEGGQSQPEFTGGAVLVTNALEISLGCWSRHFFGVMAASPLSPL